jgi:hypothetical protein
MARLEGWKAGVFVGLLLYLLSLRGAESGATTTALSSLSVSGDLLPRCAVAIGGGARPPRCANDPLVALVAALPTADPGIVFRAERGRRLVIEDGVRGAAVAVVDDDDDDDAAAVVVVVVVFGRGVFFFPLRIAVAVAVAVALTRSRRTSVRASAATARGGLAADAARSPSPGGPPSRATGGCPKISLAAPFSPRRRVLTGG